MLKALAVNYVLRVGHDSFTRDMTHSYVWDMTHSYVQ